MSESSSHTKLDVLHVSEACAGGVRRHLELILPALQQRGLRQGLFAFSARPDEDFLHLLSELEHLGCALHWMDLRPHMGLPSLFRASRRLQAMIERHQPRVLHLHSGWAGLLARLPLFGIKHGRRLYAPHAFGWQSKSAWKSRLKPRLEKYLSRHCSGYILVGREELREAEALGIEPARLHLAENGLPQDFKRRLWSRQKAREALHIPAAEKALLIPCRLAWQKGLDLLLPALAKSKMPKAAMRFYICGEGPEKKALQKMAEKLGLQERLHFCGNLPALWQKLHAFDAAILPSRYEARSYALLECMGAKLPLLCSDIPANLPQAGMLSFEAGNPDSLNQALHKLWSILGQEINYEAQATLEQQLDQLMLIYNKE